MANVEKFLDLGGMVLQDLPKVVENASVAERIEKMGNDDFTGQQIKGVREYNMCQVLHSHNDEVAIRILKAQPPAMSAGYVPLIDDKAISDEKGSDAPSVLSATEFSLTMFEMFKGVERREAQWRKLFDDAGYRVDAL
ncbi:hypothetical protein BGZ57DRAFT_926118 [Hyaloscypha finlandica]|nr:hypothetical protein BGZ57DRAFT_926118 [Hyaloscypha finlandica]